MISYTLSYTYEIIFEMCAMISYKISYYKIAGQHMSYAMIKYINKSYMILHTCDIKYNFM